MALTYKNLQDLVLNQLDETNSSTRDDVKVYLNMAGRDITNSRPWHWRRKRKFVSTATAYETGTADFTADSTSVAGTGTTWTSSHVGRKISLTYGAPFYIIKSVESTTALTLADDYDAATVSGSDYVIYDDRVTLAQDVGRLEVVWLHRTSEATERLQEVTQAVMDAIAHIPTRTSHPRGRS